MFIFFSKAYDIEIKDLKQPLLLSMPKAKDKRHGQEGPLCILPELCSLTGKLFIVSVYLP
jgi:hypothetical protein